MTQYWADACTTNCVWLLQERYIPFSDPDLEYDDDGRKVDLKAYDKFDPDHIPDEACWCTVMVSLLRHEVFNIAKRREYHYGKEGRDWRIYGVPLVGVAVEKLANQGVTQDYIDGQVKVFEQDRKERGEDER